MKKTLLVLLVLSSFSAMARGQKPNKEEVDKACGEDIAKYCEGLDKRELMECLVSKKDETSQSCQELTSKIGPPRRRN
jgi:hypothetical protein